MEAIISWQFNSVAVICTSLKFLWQAGTNLQLILNRIRDYFPHKEVSMYNYV